MLSLRSDPKADAGASDARPTSWAAGLAVASAAGVCLYLFGQAVDGVPVLLVAVAVGAAVGAILDATAPAVSDTTRPGFAIAARRVMRVGVVLLGLRLGLADIVDLGPVALAVVATTVAITFFGTQIIGRRIGVDRDTALLVATGYSICGVSAIAAMSPTTRARAEQVATAVGLVTLFGTVSMFALPVLIDLLGLGTDDAGAWIGAATHDVAQVVAAASSVDPDAVGPAVVVKLARIILLAPLVAGVAWWSARSVGASGQSEEAARPTPLPLFVAGFLAMIVVRTLDVLPIAVVDTMRTFEGIAFTIAMFGLGTTVRWRTLSEPGPRPLVLGTMAWVLVGGVALAGVLVAGQG